MVWYDIFVKKAVSNRLSNNDFNIFILIFAPEITLSVKKNS